jgi:AraC-like DNA-binding protein
MTIKLTNKDLQEMVEEYPERSFSVKNELEESRLSIENCYGKSTAKEIKTPHFCITESKIQCYENCKLFFERDECNDAFWFSSVLLGKETCHYEKKEESWLAGQANLLTCRETKNFLCFSKNKPLGSVDFMLSTEYMERIANWYPDIFERIVNRFLCGESFRVFPENIMFCPEIRRILNNILNYKAAGNAAILYLDTKILEVLSLLVCKTSQKNCSACSCYSVKDNDKLFHVKAIIEQQYQNPPSLHQLALMAGTNVCKLKTGFKELFGATVFEYLFDYRMELACKYLLDSDKSIQDIADSIGYEYHSHFSTAFKRKFGLSPLEYRNIRLSKSNVKC